jgi:Phosphodiester glycosidase
MSRRTTLLLLTIAAIAAGVGLALFHLDVGSIVARRGASAWVAITPTDPRISQSMRIALGNPVPVAIAGPFQWARRADGLETTEMPVLADGHEVDRILLVRVDPDRYRFEILNAPAGHLDAAAWMSQLHAVVVTNGSYFTRNGTPQTPLLSQGIELGPTKYSAAHGAFVVSDHFVGVRDLQQQDWRVLFRTANFGMVSYPLLVGPGASRVKADRRWLANRTFVGNDSKGRIILGTTKEAFFSLDRLAGFLKAAPLDLTLALNLDGGSVACQSVSVQGFTRDFCGDWETRYEQGQIMLLRRLITLPRRGLPIVLAVLQR